MFRSRQLFFSLCNEGRYSILQPSCIIHQTVAHKSHQKPNASTIVYNLKTSIRSRDVQTAKYNMKKLKKNFPSFQPNVGLHVMMLDMYIDEGDTVQAIKALTDLRHKHPQAAILPSKIVKLAILLAKENRISECTNLLSQEADSNAEFQSADDQKRDTNTSHYVSKLCHELLDVTASVGNTAGVQELLNVLIFQGYTNPSRQLLGYLIKAFLANEDVDGAIDAFKTIAEERSWLPAKSELLHTVIQKQHLKALEELMTISSSIIGEDNSLFDLAVCLIENNIHEEAVQMLQKISKPVSISRLNHLCSLYEKRGQADVLEGMLHCLTVSNTPGTRIICTTLLDMYHQREDEVNVTRIQRLLESDAEQTGVNALEDSNVEILPHEPQR